MKGRGNSSVITVNSALRLSINELIKLKVIQKNKELDFFSNWTNGAQINIKSVYNENECYLRLTYNCVYKTTKESKIVDYRVEIQKIQSNLGKGYNLYFICPVTKTRCKILYLCAKSEMFKCRQSYKNELCYLLQTHSKEYRLNGRFFQFDKTINKLKEKRKTNTYNDKPTKRKLRLLNLLNKRAEVDKLRDIQFENWLTNYYGFNP